MTRILLVLSLLGVATIAAAQAPSAEWRTIDTPHFRVLYPRPYEAWAQLAASRLESVRDAVGHEVGFAPEIRTDVLVMNPIAEANGATLPLLDSPRIILYTEPPGPEIEIGDYNDWIDLLTVHESAHLLHLMRPSRNATRRLLEHLLPLDPITLGAPRWVLEGYATVVEGRVTGSGRPSSSMRAAILRRWAESGRLPSYGQMSSDQRFLGMSMAYLMGSAYLEWLEHRAGPDSLRHVWARMTARQSRDFDQAFAGVFGDSPQRLYGLFTAELTARAMAVRDTTKEVDGDLWQETTRGSGDPAVSPDGKQIAVVLRPKSKPAKIVIWSTEAPTKEEATFAKRLGQILERDPDDVAPVRNRPLPRTPLHSFSAPDGGDLESPRWLADGSLLFTHRQPDRDGFLHRDLFRWWPEQKRSVRVTHLADVGSADPLPDGRSAVAVRNRNGFAQLVSVDLVAGGVKQLTEPSLERVLSHPRVSADGRFVAFAAHQEGTWQLVVREVASGTERVLGRDARANFAMPEWSRMNDGALFATVMARGFIDIERFDGTDGGRVAVTRTNGGAVDPAPSPDGRLFFMSLDPDGFVLRVLPRVEPLPAAAAETRDLVPALPPEPAQPTKLTAQPLESSRPYGIGRQELAPIVGGTYAPSSHATELGLRVGDVVGRLDVVAIGSLASSDGTRGGSLEGVWRGWPVDVSAQLFDAKERTTTGQLARHGLELRGSWQAQLPARLFTIDGGGLASSIREHESDDSVSRSLVFANGTCVLRQPANALKSREALLLSAEHGSTDGRSWSHLRAAVEASAQFAGIRFHGRLQRDRASDSALPHAIDDAISVGGIASSIVPDSATASRVLDPALETGTLIGTHYDGRRLDATLAGITVFYQQHRMTSSPGIGDQTLSLTGLQFTLTSDAVPIVRLPALDLTAGVARVVDASGLSVTTLRDKTKVWVGVRWRP